jgi:2-polyprenyl-6-hydroxyphenyl methylase / 3-demethylubiquinone-9 3-methyltransferase
MEKKRTVNNAFYETLHELWLEGNAHPVALLRAENRLRNPWILNILEKRFERKCKVLDIGCGGGHLTNTLAKQGHDVYGIDLSASSLEIAKKGSSLVHYELGRAESLSFPDRSFDVVCAMDLLEHIEEPEKVIAEAARVLEHNGLFFFHTFNRTFLSWLLAVQGVKWCIQNTPPSLHLYRLFIKPAEMRTFCSRHGLEIEAIIGVIPDSKSAAFWKMLFTRKVSDDFRFVFTPSLRTGYSGYARKC